MDCWRCKGTGKVPHYGWLQDGDRCRWVRDGDQDCEICKGTSENPPKVAYAEITRRGGLGAAGLGGWKVTWLDPFAAGDKVVVIPLSDYEELLKKAGSDTDAD